MNCADNLPRVDFLASKSSDCHQDWLWTGRPKVTDVGILVLYELLLWIIKTYAPNAKNIELIASLSNEYELEINIVGNGYSN